jgi:hypothetical protein
MTRTPDALELDGQEVYARPAKAEPEPEPIHLAHVARLGGPAPLVLAWCGIPAEVVVFERALATCPNCLREHAEAVSQ